MRSIAPIGAERDADEKISWPADAPRKPAMKPTRGFAEVTGYLGESPESQKGKSMPKNGVGVIAT